MSISMEPFQNQFGYTGYREFAPPPHMHPPNSQRPYARGQHDCSPPLHQSYSQPITFSPVRYTTLTPDHDVKPGMASSDKRCSQFSYNRASPPILQRRDSPFSSYSDRSSFDHTIFRRGDSPELIPRYEADEKTRTPRNSRHSFDETDLGIPLKLAKPEYDKEILVTSEYRGAREFSSIEEAIACLNEWAESQNVVLRKGSGNNKTMKDGTKKKFVLVCECSGKYRSCSYSPRGGAASSNSSCDESQPPQTTSPKPVKKRRSKKTSCPFRINLNYRSGTNTWVITKMVIEHNHP